jgi:hypothetical protein
VNGGTEPKYVRSIGMDETAAEVCPEYRCERNFRRNPTPEDRGGSMSGRSATEEDGAGGEWRKYVRLIGIAHAGRKGSGGSPTVESMSEISVRSLPIPGIVRVPRPEFPGDRGGWTVPGALCRDESGDRRTNYVRSIGSRLPPEREGNGRLG